MTAPITFYTHPMSRARTVRWMLEETGLPYDSVQLDYGTSMKAPEYRAINPMGKVPAIKHGDVVVTEVAAIVMYLADLVPEKHLAPPVGSPERGAYYRWIAFMAPLEQLMMAKHTGALGDPQSAGYGTEADVLATLEGALKDREHLAGNHFTAADLLVAAYVPAAVPRSARSPSMRCSERGCWLILAAHAPRVRSPVACAWRPTTTLWA